MKLTILHVGECPPKLRDRYERYPDHFERMFAAAGAPFAFDSVYILDGAPFPEPQTLDGVIITGSAAGVYDDKEWMGPLRAFIRNAYALKTPMLGVCFGHQIMADALGGDVRKSEKGWGLGRTEYDLVRDVDWLGTKGRSFAIAASHQDQVISPPKEADVYLSTDFTPNAGLVYRNGAAISVQPHPEFDATFATDLVEIRRGNPLDDAATEAKKSGLAAPLDHAAFAAGLTRFFVSRNR